MAIKIGDKVKFLNTTGGGVVTKLIDSRMVSVMVEDGFEVPTQVSELVVVGSAEPGARFFDEHYDLRVPASQQTPDPEPAQPTASDDRLQTLPPGITGGRKTEELFLAFVPHDQKWLVTGMIDVVLINNSGYDILYNIFSRNHLGHYEGMDYGNVFPDSKIVIATINREQLTHWTDGTLQFLFHKQLCNSVLPPFNSEFSIEGKKFFREGNYREHALIQARGIVVKVLSLTDYFLETAAPPRPEVAAAPSRAPEPGSLILRHQVGPREAEVDLHIHELVEDPVNMEKGEILEFQKSYFLRCLDSAMASHFLRVTFIHGVGNGVLRSCLLELLQKQEGIEFFDAPMARYGVGAIEVKLPHNH